MNAQETADVRCARWAVAAVVLAGLAALAGCSSGSAASTTPGPATVGSVPTAITVASGPSSAAPTTAASASSTSSASSASSASSTTSAEATTTTVDPRAPQACSLLTAAEASFAAGGGTTFKEGVAEAAQETPYGAHTACTWTAVNDSGITVRVSVWDDDSAFDNARSQVGSTGTVDGVGDRAFSAALASVYAAAGGHTLFVQYADLDQDDAANLAVTTSLAQLAASRL